MLFAPTSSPMNSSFFMVCLLFVGFISGDAASAVLPQLRQGALHRAQPAKSPLLQAHRLPSQKTLRSTGGQP